MLQLSGSTSCQQRVFCGACCLERSSILNVRASSIRLAWPIIHEGALAQMAEAAAGVCGLCGRLCLWPHSSLLGH